MEDSNWIWEDLRPPPAGRLGFNNARNRKVYVKSKLHAQNLEGQASGPHTADRGGVEEFPLPPAPERDNGTKLQVVELEVEIYLDRAEANANGGLATGRISATFHPHDRDMLTAELQLVFLRNPPTGAVDATLCVYEDDGAHEPIRIGWGTALIGE